MKNKTKRPIVNARKINQMRCIIGLAICSIVIILTIVSLTLNIINFYQDESPESGMGTLRMFTTLSNIAATLAASICVPFQIDGLRKNKYKLPSWVVEVMYVGTVGVALTFVIAMSLISITQGFTYAMFEKSNLFMHTLNPIFTILLFTVAISDTRIKFTHFFYSIIPVTMYSFLYFMLAIVTNVWRDHYHVKEYMPWPVALLLIITVACAVALLLRLLHNQTNKYVNRNIERYYKESPDYDFPKITNALEKLAEVESKFYYEGDDIYIPVDIIKILSERYQTSALPLDIQYDIYLENYLRNINHNKKN